MNFRTPVIIEPIPHKLDHSSEFFCLGSCFAKEMGKRLEHRLFRVTTNPLGQIFNPIALSDLIMRALDNQVFLEEEFFLHQELWKNFSVQNLFASTDLAQSVSNANKGLAFIRDSLLQSKHLIITLGSAWVYEFKDTSIVVAHNHKLPIEKFNKRLLSTHEIVSKLANAINRVQAINSELEICLTISPVRHLRDGLHENNLSKSTLLLAANELGSQYNRLHYFPSYEILLDELRDYRFYKSDLAHPSTETCDYIWEIFSKNILSEEALSLCAGIEKLHSNLSHKPHHLETKAYSNFKLKIEAQIKELDANPTLNPEQLWEKFNQLP